MYDTALSPSHRIGHPNPKIARALDLTGIVPVSPQFVDAHCRNQIAKNPPSWFVEHHVVASLLTTLGASGLSGLICLIAINTLDVFVVRDLGGSITMAALMTALMAAGFVVFILCLDLIKVKGYAKWQESYLSLEEARSEAPIQIADKAIDLFYQLPGAQIVIGRLVQDEVVLDPYLAVDYHGERVYVGIWEDDFIIA